jgi:hypothetical protein
MDRDRNREPQRISVCPAADGRKCDRANPVGNRDLEATAIASRQQFRLAVGAVTLYGPDGVNDMRCGKAIAAGDFRVSGVAPTEAHALGEQIGPGGAMYRPVDTAASEQRVVGRVDDRIHLEGRDVGEGGMERGHRQARKNVFDGSDGARPSVSTLS